MGTSEYCEFALWSERVAVQLIRAKDEARLVLFLRESNAVTREVAGVFDDLAGRLRGRAGEAAWDMLRWIARHPDPLASPRRRMRDLRHTYADVVPTAT